MPRLLTKTRQPFQFSLDPEAHRQLKSVSALAGCKMNEALEALIVRLEPEALSTLLQESESTTA